MSTAPTTESALPLHARAKTPTKAPNDRKGFRQAMLWLHTWAGLVLGWLLFAIFLTGTLSFFRNELNLWTHPEPPHHAELCASRRHGIARAACRPCTLNENGHQRLIYKRQQLYF